MAISRVWIFLALALSLAPGGVAGSTPGAGAAPPLYGFAAFPFDYSLEAVDRVREILTPASNLAAVHLDSACVPWAEALSGAPFPAWLEEGWEFERSHIPRGHVVYLALTPTTSDRTTLAPQCGEAESRPGRPPAEIDGVSFDDDDVIRAYVAYVGHAMETFDPRFVNLAIEISELSLGAPALWPRFERLYLQALADLRKAHSEVRFGLSVVLPSLLLPRVADQIRPAVEASDYLGVSFYPYTSEVGRVLGAPALPPPPDQWRDPLDFVRDYTDTPLAIAETGYTSRDVSIQAQPGLAFDFSGDERTQAAYLRDLVATVRRDDYLFVVWFVLVDYPPLLKTINSPLGDPIWTWAYAGLWSGPDRPKPAWEEWLELGR